MSRLMPPHDDPAAPEMTPEEYLRRQQHIACEAMADGILFALDLKRYQITSSLLAPEIADWLYRELFYYSRPVP